MRNVPSKLLLLSTLATLIVSPSCMAEEFSAAPQVPACDKVKEKATPKVIPLTPEQMKAELRALQTDILLKPNDAQMHVKLGDAYKRMGQNQQALDEYVKASRLDHSCYVAYHQITLLTNDEKLLDEAIETLSKMEAEKPKELLLRVALSELYEKRGNYYQAARTLIDLTYANGVPEKYRVRVSSRIHNMLSLTKTQHAQAEAPTTANTDEELDVMPAPLPTPSTKRSIAQAKLKDSKEVRGMGHTPLLP